MSDTPTLSMPARTLRWWRALQPNPETGYGGDAGALARLRRAGSVADAMAESAVHDLFHALGLHAPDALPRVAVVAMVLAHVRAHRPGRDGHPMRRVGAPGREEADLAAARMKGIRLRRLLATRADDQEDMVRQFRRLVQLADRSVDVERLAAALWSWNERTRAEWAFQYLNSDPPVLDAAAVETEPAAG